MAAKVDPMLVEILNRYDVNPKEALWDCHGTLVIYHKHLERIAAKAGIRFDPPTVIEAKSADRIVAMCVTGHMGELAEWSVGEAAPGNNKNSYPFAMAEKRAKDRVILKLVGLSGFIYSEEEADDFKAGERGPVEASAPKPAPAKPPSTGGWPYVASDGTITRYQLAMEWFNRLKDDAGSKPSKAAQLWAVNGTVAQEIVDSVPSDKRARAQAMHDDTTRLIDELSIPLMAGE